MRFKVTTFHGEGESIFHVVDTEAFERTTGEFVLASFSTKAYASKAHSTACFCRDVNNALAARCGTDAAQG